MEAPPVELRARWEAAGQGHVFRFWDRLERRQRERLVAQLAAVDVAAVLAGFREAEARNAVEAGPLEAAEVLDLAAAGADLAAQRRRRELGETLLAEGRVGVLTVAGGQGTRLGFDGPKGCFPIGPVSDRTLFGVFAQRLAGLARRVGRSVPWWIMTSPATDAETRRFFAEHDHLGLPPEAVQFVLQGSLPAIGLDGRILLEEPGRLAVAPDGHGGLFAALLGSGTLAELEARGLQALFYHHVDNPLVRVADPAYLGLHVERRAEMSCKAVAKRGPLEKVGFLCRQAGRTAILEYSEIAAQRAAERRPDGRLRFWAGSIGIHVFDLAFLRRVAEGPPLPLHLARKPVAAVDHDGTTRRPKLPNAHKIERFVFDALARARSVAVMETRREDEYSPVKNARGDASPDTARRDLQQSYRRWIREAGLAPPREEVGIEMNHARFDAPEDLRRSGLRHIEDAAPDILLAHGAER